MRSISSLLFRNSSIQITHCAIEQSDSYIIILWKKRNCNSFFNRQKLQINNFIANSQIDSKILKHENYRRLLRLQIKSIELYNVGLYLIFTFLFESFLLFCLQRIYTLLNIKWFMLLKLPSSVQNVYHKCINIIQQFTQIMNSAFHWWRIE